MRLINFVAILCALQTCEGFFLGIEKLFDFSKFQGPVPTDKDVWRNVINTTALDCIIDVALQGRVEPRETEQFASKKTPDDCSITVRSTPKFGNANGTEHDHVTVRSCSGHRCGSGCPNFKSELITSKGYPCEEHFVQTDDYFILNIQRIPHGRHQNYTKAKPKPVIFLQHGLLADSACWVFNFPKTSLAYILADNGFDVWLGNSRGNRYSRRNEKLSPDCLKFWKWSFDEMAKYDLPATIDYITKTTGQEKMVYIGHSQGTLIAFAAFSKNHTLEKNINLFIALAPIATIGNIMVPYLKTLAEVTTAVEDVAPLIDTAFLPGDIWRKEFIHKGFCNSWAEEKLCYQVGKFFFGDDPTNINYSRIPVFLNNFPSGTSFRNMVHFAQLLVSGKCQMFDYGIIENYIKYGQANPPHYVVSDIGLPIAMFSGGHDTLSDPADVTLLLHKIKNLVFFKKLQEYNHVDFVMALNANTELYPDIIELAQQYSS